MVQHGDDGALRRRRPQCQEARGRRAGGGRRSQRRGLRGTRRSVHASHAAPDPPARVSRMRLCPDGRAAGVPRVEWLRQLHRLGRRSRLHAADQPGGVRHPPRARDRQRDSARLHERRPRRHHHPHTGARLSRRRRREADPHLEPDGPPAAARRREHERRHPDAGFHPARRQAVAAAARAPRRRRARVRLHRLRRAGGRAGRSSPLDDRQRPRRLGHGLLKRADQRAGPAISSPWGDVRGPRRAVNSMSARAWSHVGARPFVPEEGLTTMTSTQHSAAPTAPAEGALSRELDALAREYGNRFLLEPAPDLRLPKRGMQAVDAMRLVGEELVLDGIPMRNLATFVTTWMEPEAQRIIAENLHRNYIDHAEYPQTAEIEQRCIRMLADLYHAPGETTGARTQGSSEAIMLGALSLKWNWRKRREAAGKDTSRPNLIFGGDVHVVWEKFCRYFDVEPRIVPLKPDKYTIGPEDVEPHVDENTIGVAAVLGTTFTGHADDIVGINALLEQIKEEHGVDVPIHVDAASGGFVWPFLYPDTEWDFRLPQVRSINVSGHKYGLVYPGIGWLVFREKSDLAEDLVFYENYLGKRDATFTLNFSTGASMVLAQYYNFVRFGHDGYRYVMETMQANARALSERIAAIGDFRLIGSEKDEQLPLVAFQLDGEHNYDEFDVASQLAAERGWMVPAYTLPPNAEHVKIMRALVKLTLGHTLATTLADDIAAACVVLADKGGLHEHDRKRAKTGTGY